MPVFRVYRRRYSLYVNAPFEGKRRENTRRGGTEIVASNVLIQKHRKGQTRGTKFFAQCQIFHT